MLRFKASFIAALLFFVVLLPFGSRAQIYDPVKWEYSVFKTGDAEYELVFRTIIEDKWHVYAQSLSSDMGPIPTSFTFNWPGGVTPIDTVIQGTPHVEYDPNFMMDLEFFEKDVYWYQKIKVEGEINEPIKGLLTYMVCNDEMCLPPTDLDFSFDLTTAKAKPEGWEYFPSAEKKGGQDDVPAVETDDTQIGDKGVWLLFLLGFGFGFVALLTPCVFPMIPMTVGFFTKTSNTRGQGIRNALIYGLFIIFIYTGLGLILTAVFGVDVLNLISTNPWFNLFLFALLVVFGVSFLGAFEITLPASWANKADQASDRGGVMGIFFMAATLAIVSFSCTGPLVGSALAGAAQGGYAGPVAVMFGFSLALALPFGLFAAFPGWLNSMPKSGGWLNSVKVVLGLLEIGFAFKFLSNADLVWQLGMLQRELFITIWIVVAIAVALYLFGKIRFSHDSPVDKLSTTRFFFGVIFLTLAVYMVPGLWGAPLKLISGFPPPMFYAENPNGLGGGSGGGHSGNHIHAKYTDYDEGLAAAKAEGKPMLVDFTGWACVNCRKMEETIWPNEKVADILLNKVVLVSLYVDERTKLPEDQQKVEMLGEKEFKVKTIGNKWTYLQASRFNINAQPYYVMLDRDGNQLGGSAQYDSNPQIFIDFLEKGLSLFSK